MYMVKDTVILYSNSEGVDFKKAEIGGSYGL